MNDNDDRKWAAYLFAMILVLGLTMWGVSAMALPSPPIDEIEKKADKLCDQTSIGLSLKWSKELAKEEQDIRKSMLFEPEVKMQAKTNALLATIGLESLVMKCAIWRRLGGGSI